MPTQSSLSLASLQESLRPISPIFDPNCPAFDPTNFCPVIYIQNRPLHMIFRCIFIGKGRFCLYLWAQVYCLSDRATVGAGLPAMDAALQAQTLSRAWPHMGRRLRIHQDRHLRIHRAHQLCIHPGHHLFIHKVSPALLQGTPPAQQH